MERIIYTVSEMQRALGIGRNTAYSLVNRADFPTVRIGKKIVIPVDALNEWLRRGGTAQNAVETQQ